MNRLLALACALAAQGGTPAAPAGAQAVPPSGARAVPLTELRANPAAYLGEEVAFALQFKALVEDWNPYLSRFESARWLALEAWPDEAFTWDEPVFEHPFARLHVRRGGGFEPLARRAHAYQRFQVHARVREVFLGEPWLEVLELTPLEGEVGEGTILHLTRARELVDKDDLDLALDQYERAKAAPLPPHALAAVLAEMQAVQAAREEEQREHRGKKKDDEEKDQEKKGKTGDESGGDGGGGDEDQDG